MQVKVFEASDMATALKMVKKSLGPDALILSTKTVRKGGRLNLLGKPTLEVTAAIESPGYGLKSTGATPPYTSAAIPADNTGTPDLTYDEIWRQRKVIEPIEDEVHELKGQLARIDVKSLRQEIRELKGLVQDYASADSTGQPDIRETNSPLLRMIGELISRNVDHKIAEQIVQRAIRQQPPQKGKVGLQSFLTRAIASSVNCGGPFFGPSSKPRRIALLGPTGVGKTTTVAKLAADYLLNHGHSLALVTIDIYRIAATEQLKVYGEIMNVPVNVAGSPEEFRRILQRHEDKDLVLIDTAGRSPRDQAGIEALQEFIGPESGVENHLVLSAATREQENHLAIRHFSARPPQSLIFTKLDECATVGQLLNIHLRHKTPLSYLTDGQRVPEDLLLAEPTQVGKLVLGTLEGK